MMKDSARLSDAMHLLAFIYINPKQNLSSAVIAVSIHTNPSYVRQLMMALRKSGILKSTRGQAKPELTRPPELITMLDVYRAVEGSKPLLHLDTNINPDCNVGIHIQYTLREYYEKVQKTAEGEMANITLADIIRGFYQRAAGQEMIWD